MRLRLCLTCSLLFICQPALAADEIAEKFARSIRQYAERHTGDTCIAFGWHSVQYKDRTDVFGCLHLIERQQVVSIHATTDAQGAYNPDAKLHIDTFDGGVLNGSLIWDLGDFQIMKTVADNHTLGEYSVYMNGTVKTLNRIR
jgi:hypothetical protein